MRQISYLLSAIQARHNVARAEGFSQEKAVQFQDLCLYVDETHCIRSPQSIFEVSCFGACGIKMQCFVILL